MTCHLLRGPEGIIVQGLLFLLAVGSLIVKKVTGPPERTWYSFGLDSSKQLAGAGWIHVLNLVFAHHLDEAFEGSTDACDWYAVNIIVDCTLGVFVEYLLLGALAVMLEACLGQNNGFESGEYRDPVTQEVDWSRYAKQLVLWLFIVSCMKVSMGIFMFLGHTWLLAGATFLYSWFQGKECLGIDAKLLAVMIVTPWLMNSFQFWMVDNFIKKKEVDDDEYTSVDSEGVELAGRS